MQPHQNSDRRAQSIRDLYQLAGVSQREFANHMGFDETSLSRVLRDKRHASHLMWAAAIGAAVLLGVRINAQQLTVADNHSRSGRA